MYSAEIESREAKGAMPGERQITTNQSGHILANIGVWSADGEWLVYDTRPDPEGAVFEGNTIEVVTTRSGEVKTLYRSQNGTHCGAPTFSPNGREVAFMVGPENPTSEWQYCAWHREGLLVNVQSGLVRHLDARDLSPPYTAGALRGGTHLHVWEPRGEWIAFTYEDHVLATLKEPGPADDINQRNIGISVPGKPVRVSKGHGRNRDGDYFSVLVTRTVTHPRPGSDEILRACEEGWIGTNGYVRLDGTRQERALAFQGTVVLANGRTNAEVFVVDLPEDLSIPGEGPLQGTVKKRPYPPRGTVQRRITFTGEQKYPGIQGPRHWLRSSPDGKQIAFLARNDEGVVQLWTVSLNGGVPKCITRNRWPIASAFTWSPDGQQLAHTMDGSVCVTEVATGRTTRLTAKGQGAAAPRPEACVFSPDGNQVAYIRQIGGYNQIFTVDVNAQRGRQTK